MPNESAVELLESLQKLRHWRKVNFAIYESPVAYDLIIFLALQFSKGEQISVKQLFSATHHSYTAIRQYYKLFLKDGLLELKMSENDGRIKYIEGTDKFFELVNSYLSEVSIQFPRVNTY